MSKTITIHLSEENYNKYKILADRDNRSISNFIETAVKRFIEHNIYVDEFEMEKIRNSAELNKSLKRGLSDMKSKKGRLVDHQKIFETNEFLKKIRKVSKQEKFFIKKKLIHYIYPQLEDEPHFGNNIKKLVGYKPETWRHRIGKYRLFYVIDEADKIIYILSIDLRKDAY